MCLVGGERLWWFGGKVLKGKRELGVGDKLLGLSNTINEVKVVLNPKTNGRKLANINNKGYFVTEDHPFMTTDGWKSCNQEISNENL